MTAYHSAPARTGLWLALACALVLSLFSAPATAGKSLSTGERALLQAVMQRHIDSHLVEGVYLQVDFERGSVRRLHPVSAHPMILQLDGYYVLCSDFRDDSGHAVNIDFYVAPKGPGHVVFQTVVDNRAPLERLVKQGKARPAG